MAHKHWGNRLGHRSRMESKDLVRMVHKELHKGDKGHKLEDRGRKLEDRGRMVHKRDHTGHKKVNRDHRSGLNRQRSLQLAKTSGHRVRKGRKLLEDKDYRQDHTDHKVEGRVNN